MDARAKVFDGTKTNRGEVSNFGPLDRRAGLQLRNREGDRHIDPKDQEFRMSSRNDCIYSRRDTSLQGSRQDCSCSISRKILLIGRDICTGARYRPNYQ